MLGYFSVSITHWTLTWITGSLNMCCVCNIFPFECIQVTSYLKGFCRVCSRTWPLGPVPSLAHNGHPVSMLWLCSVMLTFRLLRVISLASALLTPFIIQWYKLELWNPCEKHPEGKQQKSCIKNVSKLRCEKTQICRNITVMLYWLWQLGCV